MEIDSVKPQKGKTVSSSGKRGPAKQRSGKGASQGASQQGVADKERDSEKGGAKKGASRKGRAPRGGKKGESSEPRFDQLGLSPSMLQRLAEIGYNTPSPVQAGVIPPILEGADVLGQAQTGTGKTAAFAIPILEKLELEYEPEPQALILVPTRELAVQVRDEIIKLAGNSDAVVLALYGGKPVKKQTTELAKGADIIVGTPGRIIDHIGRRSLNLDYLNFVVLDEADRMLDIGFRPDIEKILKRCPRKRQTLLLSATVPPTVERLSKRYMDDAMVLDFSPTTRSVDTIDQYYFTVDHERKFELLLRLLEQEKPEQAIIFCRTKRGTERIYRNLEDHFPGVQAIHGDMQQRDRDRVMKKFRSGTIKVLVATDVVGRGIDVSSVSHIVNYDMPQSSDDYVHRVGRTGRMGKSGVAYSFVTPEEGVELTRIEMLINKLLERKDIEGFHATAAAALEADRSAALKAAEGDDAEGEQPDEKAKGSGKSRRRHRRAL